MDIFEAVSAETEHMTLDEFLQLDEAACREIKNVRIVPPSLDLEDDFGSFLIDWKTSRYHIDP